MSQTPPPPGQYPPQPPYPQQAPYQPPMMPPPNWQAPQAPRTKSKAPMIVGIVAAVVVVGAGVGYFVSQSGDGGSSTSGAVLTVPPPVAPADPGSGGNPTGVTLPGPGVSTPVDVTLPSVTAPPTTQGGSGGAGGSGTGGVLPVGSMVQMANGISIALPQGWEIYGQNDSHLEIGVGGASVYITSGSGYRSAVDGANDYVGSLGNSLSNVQADSPSPSASFTSAFVEVQNVAYSGVFNSSQGGSVPVIGWVLSGLRADGVVVILDSMWANDGSGKPSATFTDGLTTIFASSVLG